MASRHIFIVGYPRSGTTYLQSLMATQPTTVSFPETHFYSSFTNGIDLAKPIPADKVLDIIDKVEEYVGVKPKSEDREELRSRAQTGQLHSKELMAWVMQKAALVQGVDIASGDHIIIEKTPSHAFHMERILKDFPEAQFVQITRHPVPAIDSYHHRLSKGKKPLSTLIDEWQRSHEAVLRFKKTFPERIHTVQYEALRDNPQKEMKRLTAALGMVYVQEDLAKSKEVAASLVRPFEEWKKENTKPTAQFNPRKGELSWKEIATIQFLLRSRLEAQGYSVRRPLLQKVYDLKNGGAR